MNEIDSEKEIREYQKHLNDPSLVPAKCYRRNVFTYNIVSYVNQLTGLYLSENYKPIPVFIDRIMYELDKVEVPAIYSNLVQNYISHVTTHINEFCAVPDFRPASDKSKTIFASGFKKVSILRTIT